MHTPISLEGSALDPFGAPRHQAKTTPINVVQNLGWGEPDFGPIRQLGRRGDISSTEFLRMYQDDFIGGTLGYIAPFETATQDDMLAAAGFAGNDERQISYDFGIPLET